MTLRRIIALVALVGVLMHAGMVARHHVMMIAMKLEHRALAASLGVICHSDGSVVVLPETERPVIPEPLATEQCPLCAGLSPAMALLPAPLELMLPATTLTSACIAARTEIIAHRISDLRPPPRGPPA